jgi:SDR family mycofactocin-dependent oxidoreductase
MGRAHAVRLAQEGADIIAIDLCAPVDAVQYEPASPDDLAETARRVEDLGRKVVTREVDVRDQQALDQIVRDGVNELGRLDVVCANAAIATLGTSWKLDEQVWRDTIDINLTGVWHTAKAAIPTLIDAGRGGSIVLTSSLCGVRGLPNVSHYVSAKHGVIGLTRSLANEVGPHQIRVNSVLPGNTRTDMAVGDWFYRAYRPDLENPTENDVVPLMRQMNPMELDYLEPEDIANAVLFFASDEARYVTGVAMSVDAGWHIK